MKKLTILSVVVAGLLLSGCGQKEQKSHETKSVASTQSSVSSAQSSVKEMIEEALPGTPVKAKVEAPAPKSESKHVSSAAESSMANVEKNVSSAANSVTAAVKEKAQEVKSVIDGAKLYAKCAACHGPHGKRKALGKSGIIAGMSKDEVLKKLKGYKDGTLNQYGMGALMKTQVASLSEQELEALATYISNLK